MNIKTLMGISSYFLSTLPKISKQIFVQASAIELAHIAERSRKCQEIELAHIAERSRKCQEKVHLYEEKKKDARRMDTHPFFL